jgi:hypothetical protein
VPFVRKRLQVFVLSGHCKYFAHGLGAVTDLHICVHVGERPLGLVEEVKDDALAKLPLARFFIHVEDLFEGSNVDIIAEVDVVRLENGVSLQDCIFRVHCD